MNPESRISKGIHSTLTAQHSTLNSGGGEEWYLFQHWDQLWTKEAGGRLTREPTPTKEGWDRRRGKRIEPSGRLSAGRPVAE